MNEEEDFEIPEESKISKTLSDKTTKTVVMLVLVLLFMLAVCSSESYVDSDILHEQGLKNLVKIYDRKDEKYCLKKEGDACIEWRHFYDDYRIAYNHYEGRTTSKDIEYKLVFLEVPNPFLTYEEFIKMDVDKRNKTREDFFPNLKLSNLRKDEYASVILNSKDGSDFIASYSTKSYTIVES